MVSVKNEDIQRIIDLVKSNDIDELEIQDGKKVIRVRNQSQGKSIDLENSSCPTLYPKPKIVESHSSEKSVKSPLVGTVYLASSPDQAPFVKVGSHVKKGQTMCLVEAMKTFNHIKSNHDGVVSKICIKNGQTVEFEQALFLISDQ